MTLDIFSPGVWPLSKKLNLTAKQLKLSHVVEEGILSMSISNFGKDKVVTTIKILRFNRFVSLILVGPSVLKSLLNVLMEARIQAGRHVLYSLLGNL